MRQNALVSENTAAVFPFSDSWYKSHQEQRVAIATTSLIYIWNKKMAK